jgi:hypothetical protein
METTLRQRLDAMPEDAKSARKDGHTRTARALEDWAQWLLETLDEKD